jgi:hypothetical protein
MSNDKVKHENPNGHGDFERQDLQPSGILYFLLSLAVATVICMFGLKGLYAYLDHRERSTQEPVNPLVKHVPEDTRHIPPGYPQTAFPNPRLETDERGQLNGILTEEEDRLYTYGWVDEKAGTIHIPIDRAMDLLVQRGLPVRPQGATSEPAAAQAENDKRANQARGAHGKVNQQ